MLHNKVVMKNKMNITHLNEEDGAQSSKKHR